MVNVMYATEFTPMAAIIGGLLVGTATTVLWLFNGRIAGISGILGNLLSFSQAGNSWRWAFLGGMLLSPWLWRLGAPLESVIEADLPTLIIAGLLVGVGSRMGSGCTSGHGVCGLSRGSQRSFIATLAFMLAGFITVFIIRHLIGG